MTFILIGVNHNSAPVEVRERLAIPESRLAEAITRLMQFPGVEEGMILSTCNRVELIANVGNGSVDLRGFLREYFETDTDSLAAHLYEYREQEAMRHIFRVAASLDSMIVGEPQVLGQVKAAYAVACGVGALHSQLHALISRAFAVAKRVRTETAIGSSAVSVASAAVDLATQIFGSLAGKHIYLVGAGKMSELAARHLIAGGAEAIFVANRTHARALVLAEKFQGTAIHFEELYETADRADIVITSTGSPHAIFRRDHGERFLHRRKNRPMFFIDIAVPRDVDPEMNKLDGIFVYDIDDLQAVVSANVASREREAARAHEIIEAELQRFIARLQTQEVAPTIISLQEHLENIRQAELDRARGRLGKLTAEQESAVEALTRGIINKVLHTPITALKNAAGDAESNTVIDHVRRIFNLNPRNLTPRNPNPGNSDSQSSGAKSPDLKSGNARRIPIGRPREEQEEPLSQEEKKATPS
jgi:glutamyl-tRNA reductase